MRLRVQPCKFIVMCVHSLQVVVLLCTLQNSPVKNTVKYLYFKPGMPGSKYKSSDDVVGTAISPYLPAVVLYYCTFQSTALQG